MPGNGLVRFGRAVWGNGPAETPTPRPRPIPLGSPRSRDVEIHHEPESWTVEVRQSGSEGDGKRWAAATEDEARKMAEQLMRTDERRRPMG
jgi:hypothetical protein